MTAEPQSIPELLKQRVTATPDKPFLFSEADKRQFTYKQFEAAVMRTARMLGRRPAAASARSSPMGIEPTARAEEIPVEGFVSLARIFAEQSKAGV